MRCQHPRSINFVPSFVVFCALLVFPLASFANSGGLTLYSIGDPSDQEQLYVEYVNRARLDPIGEGLRLKASPDPIVVAAYTFYSVDLDMMTSQFASLQPAPPLSINGELLAAARLHSQDMFANAFQSHNGSDGSSFITRANAQGYGGSEIGENVFAYATSVEEGHAAFEVDWGGDASTGGMQDPPGHRLNIHTTDFTDIGVALVLGINGSVGPQVVTEDFGHLDGGPSFITGVVYYDLNGNGAYDAGEGVPGVTVRADSSTYYAVTAHSGGYSVPVPADGSYVVTFSVPNIGDNVVAAVVKGGNQKLDLAMPYAGPGITGLDHPLLHRLNTYSFVPVGAATGYQWRQGRLVAGTWFDGAENGLNNVTPLTSPGYPVIDSEFVASGLNSFHLAQPSIGAQTNSPPQVQALLLNATFLGAPAAQLSFASRLSWASSNQVARAQISVDDGQSWNDLWIQPGDGGSGDTNFITRTVDLSTWAGKLFRVRFLYDYLGGNFYNSTEPRVGLHLDDITISGALQFSNQIVADLPNTSSFSFFPTELATYAFTVRPVISDRVLPWGPVKVVSPQTGSGPLLHLTALRAVGGTTWVLDFSVENPSTGVYQVQGAPGPSGPWSLEPNSTVQPDAASASLRALIPAGPVAARFYRVVLQ
jgi:hypothetical protein